jgi:hypothetical protein
LVEVVRRTAFSQLCYSGKGVKKEMPKDMILQIRSRSFSISSET